MTFTNGDFGPEAPTRLITVKELSAKLQVSASAIYRWVEQGRCSCVRIGSLVRFRPEDVEAIVQVVPRRP